MHDDRSSWAAARRVRFSLPAQGPAPAAPSLRRAHHSRDEGVAVEKDGMSGTMPSTRPHLHYGICRQCYGTGMVANRHHNEAKQLCWDCEGQGAVA